MAINRRPEGLRRLTMPAMLAVALGGIGLFSAMAHGQAAIESPPPDRADASVIKAETEKILADPRLSRRPSLMEWLVEKLGGPNGPSIDWNSGWARVLFWLILLFCILSLLAILAHLIWTLYVLFHGERGAAGEADLSRPHFGLVPPNASYQELEAMRRRLADEGRFREAVAVMMAALLRWLEAAGLVQFHPGKTNGDYLREFPPIKPGREALGDFIREFDGTVYSGLPCGVRSYQQMESLLERVFTNVGPKS